MGVWNQRVLTNLNCAAGKQATECLLLPGPSLGPPQSNRRPRPFTADHVHRTEAHDVFMCHILKTQVTEKSCVMFGENLTSDMKMGMKRAENMAAAHPFSPTLLQAGADTVQGDLGNAFTCPPW